MSTKLKTKFLGRIFLDIRDPDVGISLTPALGCPGQKLHAGTKKQPKEYPKHPAILKTLRHSNFLSPYHQHQNSGNTKNILRG